MFETTSQETVKPKESREAGLTLSELYEQRAEYYRLQLLLMPLAYQKNRKGKKIDMSDPAKRTEVGLAWVNKRYAERMEEYIKAHPDERIDPDDMDSVQEFWTSFTKKVKLRTIH